MVYVVCILLLWVGKAFPSPGDSGVKVSPEVCGQSRQLQRYAACVPRMRALASLGLASSVAK